MRQFSMIAGTIAFWCYAFYLGRGVGRREYRDEMLRGILDQFSAPVPERNQLLLLLSERSVAMRLYARIVRWAREQQIIRH